MTNARPARAPSRTRARLRDIVLERFVAGRRISQIADELELRQREVEALLARELQHREARPLIDFAKIQLERLERILGALAEKAGPDALREVEVFLKALDRCEKYYRLLKGGGIQFDEAAAERRTAVEKVTKLMMLAKPAIQPPDA
jgi:hypothetical protein